MKKFFVFFLSFCFLLNFYEVPAVFAQGAEYLRIRPMVQAVQESDSSQKKPPKNYFINEGDTIQVFVWQNPDLSKNVIVAPDGKISYPLVGRIQAAGLTIDQLEAKITQGIALYVRDPKVSLMITAFAPVKIKDEKVYKIVILGEVNYPGIYTYNGTINLIDAIAQAGSLNEKAREDSVLVIHGNFTGKTVVRRINFAKIIRKGDANADLNLSPNDVVFVPKSFIADFNKFLTNINPMLATAQQVFAIAPTAGDHPFRK